MKTLKNKANNDLRVQRTLQNIDTAFKEMILEMDYEKITVKELSNRAKINKKTFYSHYSSLDELLARLQEEMSEKFIISISSYKLPKEFNKVNRDFFIFLEENGKWFEKITSSSNFEYIRQKMVDTVMENTWEKTEFVKQFSYFQKKMFYSYIQFSALSIYTQWISDGKKIPIDEVIEFSTKLITKGIEGVLKEF